MDYMFGNGPNVRIMSQSELCLLGLCRIRNYVFWDYVAFGVMSYGIMLHLELCLLGLCRNCRIRSYVFWDYVAFGVMSFGITQHLELCLLGLCCIRRYVFWD